MTIFESKGVHLESVQWDDIQDKELFWVNQQYNSNLRWKLSKARYMDFNGNVYDISGGLTNHVVLIKCPKDFSVTLIQS